MLSDSTTSLIVAVIAMLGTVVVGYLTYRSKRGESVDTQESQIRSELREENKLLKQQNRELEKANQQLVQLNETCSRQIGILEQEKQSDRDKIGQLETKVGQQEKELKELRDELLEVTRELRQLKKQAGQTE